MNIFDVLVLFTFFILLVTAADVLENRLVSTKNKVEILIICGLIFAASVCEYISEVTGGRPGIPPGVQRLSHMFEFCLWPYIGVSAAIAYGNAKRWRTAVLLVSAHTVFQLVSFHTEWVFRVDAQNVYHREKLYFVYVIGFMAAIIYCYVCVIAGIRKYQARAGAVNILILTFLAFGVSIQFFYSDVCVDFLTVAIANFFLYHHRGTVVSQVDVTTKLLNRRCYERMLSNIKAPSYVLIFDINKFKAINDTFGHADGDACLALVARKLLDTYEKSGYCFRIGGDEFCVILHKDLDKLELLNQKFRDSVQDLSVNGHPLYGVSLGYAYYDQSCPDIDAVVKEADERMYQNKASVPV